MLSNLLAQKNTHVHLGRNILEAMRTPDITYFMSGAGMKMQQSQCRVDSPSSHCSVRGSQTVRRVMDTYLFALMPSLRVAKPSATRDSAMFSPLVSEEEKRGVNFVFKSNSSMNNSSNSKRALMGPLSPIALQGMMLPANGTRQQGRVGFSEKPLLPQNV